MPNRPLVAPQVQAISFDPAAAMQDVASIQINRQNLEAARQKSMEAMEVRQLAAQYPDDPDGFVNALQRVAPERAAIYSEKLWSGRREAALAHKAQTDASLAQLQAGIQLLQGATPDTYKPRVDMLLKLSPELGQIIPADYDPQKLQGLFQVGQKTENFLKAQADAAALLADKKTRESVLTAFAGASNQQQWDANAKLFADAGLGSLVAASVGPQWSPEAQAAAAKASISPEKQADDARAAAAEKRLTEAQAETVRHNRVSEGISGAHLAVSRATEARLAKGGAASTKPSTGAEKKNLGYFNRLKQADEELDKLEKSVSEMGLGGQLRMELLPNFAQSQTGQSYQQAQREFTEARLRKESGAAIPESEYENDRKTYFVQPGDSAQTIAQKKRARAALKASFSFDAGRALGEFYGEDAEGMTAKFQAESKGQSGGIKVTAPNGKSYTFATQAQADIFKKRAGID